MSWRSDDPNRLPDMPIDPDDPMSSQVDDEHNWLLLLCHMTWTWTQ